MDLVENQNLEIGYCGKFNYDWIHIKFRWSKRG